MLTANKQGHLTPDYKYREISLTLFLSVPSEVAKLSSKVESRTMNLRLISTNDEASQAVCFYARVIKIL